MHFLQLANTQLREANSLIHSFQYQKLIPAEQAFAFEEVLASYRAVSQQSVLHPRNEGMCGRYRPAAFHDVLRHPLLSTQVVEEQAS